MFPFYSIYDVHLFMEEAQLIAASAPSDPCPDRSENCAHCGARSAAAFQAERQLQQLRRIADMGEAMVKGVQELFLARVAKELADGVEGTDLTPAFARATRALRLTMALESKIVEAQDKRNRKETAAQTERQAEQERDAAAALQARKARRKDKVRRTVEQAITAGAEDGAVDWGDVEDLRSDLRERLDDDDIEDELADRPIGEIVAGICQDFGLSPDWNIWAHKPWAIEEARTKPPGSPYASYQPEPATDGESRPGGQGHAPAEPPAAVTPMREALNEVTRLMDEPFISVKDIANIIHRACDAHEAALATAPEPALPRPGTGRDPP